MNRDSNADSDTHLRRRNKRNHAEQKQEYETPLNHRILHRFAPMGDFLGKVLIPAH
jgi:hypothetical protein